MGTIKESDYKKINKEMGASIKQYKKTMSYMAGDAPIGVLGLPKCIETILTNQGFLRVYDLLDTDLIKIKGIGKSRVQRLASSLNEFLPIC